MSQLLCLFTVLLLSSCPSNATVTLTSSADILCPGDTVVFTCVTTDTGRLIWEVDKTKQSFHSPALLNIPITLDIFTVTLLSVTNSSIYQSTAVAHNVSVDYNWTSVKCIDGGLSTSNNKQLNIIIASPPSPPLNLTAVVSTVNSSVTISWVAPLDTPLCVHSYTVTVRNSCNSFQVMVYNSTDNRTSLGIIDLTSDGEYSMTMAGRDGTGRLGQESEELRISFKILNIELHGYNLYHNRMIVQWILTEQLCYPLVKYLITHNVSSDQSTITVNRTNVTLYGVQPGETYTVEITPCYENTLQCKQTELRRYTFIIPGIASINSLTTSSYVMSYSTKSAIIEATDNLMPTLGYSTCCPEPQSTFGGSYMMYKTNSPTAYTPPNKEMIPLTTIVLVVLSVIVVLFVVTIIVILIFCLIILKKATFSDRKKETMSIEQPAKRYVIKEDSQSTADKSTGDHIELRGEDKETSEGVYEEIDFTMEYNMSYSTVTQTAM